MRSEWVHTLRKKAKDGSVKDIWRDWKWIWSFSARRKKAVAMYVLCGVISSGMGLLSGVVSKYMIDAIVSLDMGRLLPCCGYMVASVVAMMVFRSLTNRMVARLNVDMLTDVQQTVFRQMMDADWLHISRYPSGELLSRFSSDVGTVATSAVSWLPQVIIQLFSVISTVVVMAVYDPVMALIGCASTPVLFLMSRSVLSRQRRYDQRMRQVGGAMSAFQAETFRNMDTLKSFGVEHTMTDRLRDRQEEYRQAVLEQNRFSIRTNNLMTVMGTLVEYGALAYCLWRLWRGDILFGTMTLFLQQRTRLSSAFSGLVSLIPTALSASVAAERVRELTELPKEPSRVRLAPPEGRWSVELTDVSLGYGPERQILSHVDLKVPAGSLVALVGPSGEGKTTLLRLLLGLIRPTEGRAELVGPHGERQGVGADTRHFFTYVPQGNTVIAGTVAQNLALVDPAATEKEMIQVLEDACAWEFVKDLPQGLHARLGEGGRGISEGQAQRIAIARALMRRSPVMLLDEVTSALDQDTERRVLENLSRRGVTTIVTTHRPSVLDQAQRVYQVRDGQVIRLEGAKVL